MAKIVSAEKIILKNHPEIKEDTIQQYIFENPRCLGLGDIYPIRREKKIPSGGRLDLLLGDEDIHYETEIQLGATDPSHIIRTIEYWDSEKKRYPQYDHCAVIIAEDITSRFLNVISLFNGSIPLIAIQMNAYKHGNDVNLCFTTILDRVTVGSDEENETEPVNRAYWEGKTNKISLVDMILKDVQEYAPDFELKYNRQYIGMARKNGAAANFIYFRARKEYVWLYIKVKEEQVYSEALENSGLEFESRSRGRIYRVKICNTKDYQGNKDILADMIHKAMETV